ncbi:hypothetical protein GWI33_001650 [Rhynchophorus ferrugineus]|uniref:Uncharacterized protein n=1 Tax=Rhynchophorus ferrugineus TaxID=354439 RepID=A0A834IQ95_RHYFE|nr:hypothetical protein GWI33_001650 [Rhynchophorus ferrugineus]
MLGIINLQHKSTRHSNDLVATSLKVAEWNKGGRNNAFLYKTIGEKKLLMKLGAAINCQYLMSDDDPRFYNVWEK